MTMNWHESVGATGHIASAGAIVFAILGWLPPLAALVGLIWYCIQIHESKTMQDWLKRQRVRKINALRAQLLVLTTAEKVEDIKVAVKEAGAAAVKDIVDQAVKPKTGM